MARSLNASCTSCGYTASAELGGVRSNYLTFFAYPHICRDCKEVFSGNLYEEPCPCTECGSESTLSYESRDARRFRRSDDQVVAQSSMVVESKNAPTKLTPLVATPVTPKGFTGWLRRIRGLGEAIVPPVKRKTKFRELRILNKGNLCPKCDQTKLEFSVFAFVD